MVIMEYGFRDPDNILRQYMQDISRMKPLKPHEEFALAARIRDNDPEAVYALVCANLRFVVSVAKNYMNQGMELPDLINEGNLGLIRAAYRFDENRNFRFISYAVWWVRRGILQALANQSRITRIPVNKVAELIKIKKSMDEYMQRHMAKPDEYDLVGDMKDGKARDAKLDRIREAINIANRHLSLDKVVSDGSDSSLVDALTYDDQDMPDCDVTAVSLTEHLEDILKPLNDREKEIVRMYFGVGYGTSFTLKEIGRKFNLSRERVRQIKDRALDKVRWEARYDSFRDYFVD